MVIKNMIQNCPITASDTTNDHTLFGPNLSVIMSNTVWKKPNRVLMEYVAVPKNFFILHKFVTLVANVLFLNGEPFWITMSSGVQFVTVKLIPTGVSTY